MKFPLDPPPFQCPPLSEEARQRLIRIAHSVLAQAIIEYAANGSASKRKIRKDSWKLVSKKESVAVYKQLPLTPKARIPNARISEERERKSSSNQLPGSSSSVNFPLNHTQDRESSSIADGSPASTSTSRPSALATDAYYMTAANCSIDMIAEAKSTSVSSGFLPLLQVVGKIGGSLDEVMYGICTPTVSSCRIKTSYVNDNIADHQVLYQLESPSVDNPFHNISIRWAVKASPPAFVKPRDFIILHSTGITRDPTTNERMGFLLSFSLNLQDEQVGQPPSLDQPGSPVFAPLPGIYRAQIFSTALYKETSYHSVEVVMKCVTGPRGKVLETLAVHSAANGLVYGAFQSVYCAEMKKLAWMLHQKGLLSGRSAPLQGSDEPSPVSGSACSACEQGFSTLSSRSKCDLCGMRVCKNCVIPKEVSYETAHRLVKQKRFKVCKTCMARATSADTFHVAQQEIQALQTTPSRTSTRNARAFTTTADLESQMLKAAKAPPVPVALPAMRRESDPGPDNKSQSCSEDIETIDTSTMQAVRKATCVPPTLPREALSPTSTTASPASCFSPAAHFSASNGIEQQKMLAQITDLLQATERTSRIVNQMHKHSV